jgi:hypothetical protein
MAANLVFKFLANDKGLKDGINRSKKDLNSLGSVTKSVSTSMKRTLGAVGLSLGFTAVIRGLVGAGKAAAADAKSQRLLALQMQTTMHATDKQIASNEKFIGVLSNQVGIVDDELRPAFAKLLRGTGNVAKAQKLLKIALDGSAASGKPLSAVTDAIVKAQNGQLTSLYRLAPQLKITKGGIDQYAASVKGAAQTAADPFSRVKVVMDNLNEQIGQALLPAFEGLANWFVDNGPTISKFLSDLFNPKTSLGKNVTKLLGDLERIIQQLDKVFAQFDPEKKSGLIGFLTILNTTLDITVKSIKALADVLVGQDKKVADKVFMDVYKPAPVPKTGIGSNMSDVGRGSVTINVNKANTSAADIVKMIQVWQTQTGRQYLLPGTK